MRSEGDIVRVLMAGLLSPGLSLAIAERWYKAARPRSTVQYAKDPIATVDDEEFMNHILWIGGRIHTMHFPAICSEEDGQDSSRSLRACRVDLGASYIHGYDFEDYLERTGLDINPLQALAKEHKLRTAVNRNIPQQYSNG